jgi:hypothetical protein
MKPSVPASHILDLGSICMKEVEDSVGMSFPRFFLHSALSLGNGYESDELEADAAAENVSV